MIRTLIAVPTYNELLNVEKMVGQLVSLGLDADLLFIDDDSPDGTGEMLDRLAASTPRLTVLHRQGKLGIGSAHLDGIEFAYDRDYDRLITLDCDFTHDPRDILRLVANSPGYDLVTGSRYLESDSLPGWNILRRSLTGFGHLLTKHLLNIPFDATGALRCYDLRRIPRTLFHNVKHRGYGFFYESMFVLVRAGCSVKEIPIVLPARTYGSSKMTVRETWRSGSHLLLLWGRYAVKPAQYRSETRSRENAGKNDSESWDGYWRTKTRPTSKLYDAVAGLYRTQVIKRRLESAIFRTFDDGSHLLHAGCGSGQVDTALHQRLRITAVDISPEALSLYARNNPTAHDIRRADILQLPFVDETFDGAYNLGVMEHFTSEEIGQILRELNRVLKPGGRLVLFWPHAKASSVAFLGSLHWLMNDVLRRPIRLHPPEISLLESRQWAEGFLEDAGFRLRSFSFGAQDLFVQAVLFAEKPRSGGTNA